MAQGLGDQDLEIIELIRNRLFTITLIRISLGSQTFSVDYTFSVDGPRFSIHWLWLHLEQETIGHQTKVVSLHTRHNIQLCQMRIYVNLNQLSTVYRLNLVRDGSVCCCDTECVAVIQPMQSIHRPKRRGSCLYGVTHVGVSQSPQKLLNTHSTTESR